MAKQYLGLDVGSVSVAVVLIDEDGAILQSDYERHAGESEAVLTRLLGAYPLDGVCSYALTGPGAGRLGLEGRFLDATVTQLEGVRRFDPDVRNLFYIGGGSFSLTYLDENGGFLRNTTNSACASGTGAFIDQQALRLGIAPEELGRIAAGYEGLAPPVATRCAVFAKTDMIHLQQEGFPIEAVAKGLCNGLGASTVEGLLGGTSITGKAAVVGGVALNECVVAAIREKLGVETVVPDRPELIGALGAAYWARDNGAETGFDAARIGALQERADRSNLRRPLDLELSTYSDFAAEDFWVDEKRSEIALLVACEAGQTFEVAMGIDIGSTSTKATLTERSGRTVAWVYRKTAGAPLEATQHVCRAFRSLEEKHDITFDIIGAGTTGSGRKMVGCVIGADIILNEITAHARAAIAIAPEVDTILELGGQDAKFTQLANGVVYNSVMNYVCAAGTGSFIEEQAQKLDVPIQDYASLALGVEAPVTSDRCTVYMERDLDLLLAAGWSKAEVAAAVLHSVCDNYLNKVVGGLSVGQRVMFQGATARNRALVAAFEQRLGVPITVSPLCHVTGAMGMALYVIERVKTQTMFRGLSFADEEITIENEVCELCHNRCRLSLIRMRDDTVAWGLKCGREYEEERPKPKDVSGYRFLRRRERHLFHGVVEGETPRKRAPGGGPRIGIPRALSMYGYLPLWRTFFETLGCQVTLSAPTKGDTLARGEALVSAEFCAPLLVGFGHVVKQVATEVDYIFVPHTIRESCSKKYTNAYFCCYVQAYPSMVRSFEEVCGKTDAKVLAPIVDYSDHRVLATDMARELSKPLGVTRRQIRRALEAGFEVLERFRADNLRAGLDALESITSDKDGEKDYGIVLIGRPYNTLDPGLNLDLPRKIAEMGHVVLYMDMLDVSPERVAKLHPNMYWQYGQRILSVADYVANHPALFPIYFTSFSCGPDSYIVTYFKEIMGAIGKPYLVLQFDGHGADAGYLTRIEAALESFQAYHAESERRSRPESALVS